MLFGAAAPTFAQEVVVNPDISVASLDVNTLRSIFGMRQSTWPDGSPIRVYVLDDGSGVHRHFAKDKLNIFAYQLEQAWDRLVFSGTGQAPSRVKSLDEMRDRITATPGAIGYLPEDWIDKNVSVVRVEKQ
ncbi:MAG: hypothetical protein U9R74_17200 [Pseudomonadota bacterium]|nr:hypothetical protein [Pseudomonadota bacterium]